MKPDFDRVAAYYYPLSRIVLGTSPQRAQEHFIGHLRSNSHILIVGGGNGHLLPPLLRSQDLVRQITFVESSMLMIEKAREKHSKEDRIVFVNSTIEEFLASSPFRFDAILTGFFFDLFPLAKATDLHQQLFTCLSPSGLWIDTDFQLTKSSPVFHKLLVKIMYAFFRQVSGVEANCLPPLETQWTHSLTLRGSESFYDGFIKTRLWQKGPL
jgi:spermidine synthase